MKGLNLLIRFLLEIGLLVGLVYWGRHAGQTASSRILRVGSAALVALVWGLDAAGLSRSAIAYGIVATINTAILFAFETREQARELKR